MAARSLRLRSVRRIFFTRGGPVFLVTSSLSLACPEDHLGILWSVRGWHLDIPLEFLCERLLHLAAFSFVEEGLGQTRSVLNRMFRHRCFGRQTLEGRLLEIDLRYFPLAPPFLVRTLRAYHSARILSINASVPKTVSAGIGCPLRYSSADMTRLPAGWTLSIARIPSPVVRSRGLAG